MILFLGPGGSKKMFAAIMPNEESVKQPVSSFMTTVGDVERRTGFDFFSKLEDEEERALEAKKETFPETTKKRPKSHN